jgi:SAM-dependent methyltransferase
MISRLIRFFSDAPLAYLFTQFVIGGMKARRICVTDYVRPVARQRVLDIGCGPGYTAAYYPKVDYLGYDTDTDYIRYANERYGDRGLFRCGVLTAEEAKALGTFDVVTLMGVLHHMDDATVLDVLRLARGALRPGGRVVALEGCYVPGQSPFAKWMLDNDRGKFVRDEAGYRRLAEQVFDDVKLQIRHDLFHIPYTKAVISMTDGPITGTPADGSARAG